MDLDQKVFGRITAKEIIGARPKAVPDTRDMLASELEMLLAGLEAKSRDDLMTLLKAHERARSGINSRPGSMALAQDKIRLFNEYSGRYTDAICKALS